MPTVKIDIDGVPYWEQQYGEKKSYSIDWTDWLAEISAAIASVTWTVPSGLDGTSQTSTTVKSTIFLANTSVAGTYDCKALMTADDANGSRDTQWLRLKVKEK